MKKYMKNKDFVPEKFYNKIELNKIKNENKIFTFFLIINLLFIPTTVKSIQEINENNMTSTYDATNEQNKYSINDINLWIENIMRDDIGEAYITNNNGEVIVDSLDKVDELSSSASIEISDVNLNTDDKYRLGVSLND